MCTRAVAFASSAALIPLRSGSRISRSPTSVFSRTSPSSVAARTSAETCLVSRLETLPIDREIGEVLTLLTVHIVADNSTKQAAEHHRHSTKSIVSLSFSYVSAWIRLTFLAS